MTIDEATLKKIATEIANEIAGELRRTVDSPKICEVCTCERDRDMHEQHHRVMREFIIFLGKINKMKWASLSAVAVVLLVSFVGWILLSAFGIKITK